MEEVFTPKQLRLFVLYRLSLPPSRGELWNFPQDCLPGAPHSPGVSCRPMRHLRRPASQGPAFSPLQPILVGLCYVRPPAFLCEVSPLTHLWMEPGWYCGPLLTLFLYISGTSCFLWKHSEQVQLGLTLRKCQELRGKERRMRDTGNNREWLLFLTFFNFSNKCSGNGKRIKGKEECRIEVGKKVRKEKMIQR